MRRKRLKPPITNIQPNECFSHYMLLPVFAPFYQKLTKRELAEEELNNNLDFETIQFKNVEKLTTQILENIKKKLMSK